MEIKALNDKRALLSHPPIIAPGLWEHHCSMIILNTSNASNLWKKIHTSVREHRFECWEYLPSGQLALFKWPTRHTKLLMFPSINNRQNRLVLLDQNGSIPCSSDCLMRHQEDFLDRLSQQFADIIESTEIVDTTAIFHSA